MSKPKCVKGIAVRKNVKVYDVIQAFVSIPTKQKFTDWKNLYERARKFIGLGVDDYKQFKNFFKWRLEGMDFKQGTDQLLIDYQTQDSDKEEDIHFSTIVQIIILMIRMLMENGVVKGIPKVNSFLWYDKFNTWGEKIEWKIPESDEPATKVRVVEGLSWNIHGEVILGKKATALQQNLITDRLKRKYTSDKVQHFLSLFDLTASEQTWTWVNQILDGKSTLGDQLLLGRDQAQKIYQIIEPEDNDPKKAKSIYFLFDCWMPGELDANVIDIAMCWIQYVLQPIITGGEIFAERVVGKNVKENRIGTGFKYKFENRYIPPPKKELETQTEKFAKAQGRFKKMEPSAPFVEVTKERKAIKRQLTRQQNLAKHRK